MSEDNELLKERLFTREISLKAEAHNQRATLAKCAFKFQELLHAIVLRQHRRRLEDQEGQEKNQDGGGEGDGVGDGDGDGDGDEAKSQSQSSKRSQIIENQIQTTKNQLILELKLHDIEMKKIALGCVAGSSELEHYDALSADTQQSIQSTREAIASLRTKLVHCQKVKKHRMEYEKICENILKRPSIYQTKRKLEQTNKEIEDLQLKRKKADEQVDMRRKQFQGLMQNIFDLKNSLEEDAARQDIAKNNAIATAVNKNNDDDDNNPKDKGANEKSND